MPLDTIQPARHLAQGKYFYGVRGTPFIDAAEAWFWALDCLEARTERSRGCSALKVGRPCEPDDVVNAIARLDLPKAHARTMISWGKRRMVPPEATEARRFWDEVIARLSVVLVIKGIVRLPLSAADRREQDAALMDVPLTGLFGALEKLGAAVAERAAQQSDVPRCEARVG